ncbi:hypothetical protein HOLleu_17618 [Holothuria leucospilota]|uniref:Uncharacterized protein n=1 Tax=Holothuria leucospilota TaxID=206669 RepID=A0A9Q1H8G1_HOLLE|nr:hypothetical protein HOLleu_17618 [Holothuria leucospilota]
MLAIFSNFLQKEPKIFSALRTPNNPCLLNERHGLFVSFKHRFGTLFPSLRLWVAGLPVGELGPPVGEILAPPLANCYPDPNSLLYVYMSNHNPNLSRSSV